MWARVQANIGSQWEHQLQGSVNTRPIKGEGWGRWVGLWEGGVRRGREGRGHGRFCLLPDTDYCCLIVAKLLLRAEGEEGEAAEGEVCV